MRRGPRRSAALLVALLALISACSTTKTTNSATSNVGDAGDCLVIDAAVSPEKIELITALAREFNKTKTQIDGRCVFVNPTSKASGAAMDALSAGWDTQSDGPAPTIWSPASSAWGAILDQHRASVGQGPMAGEGTAFMNTPLVIAMPKPMAQAIGWPDKPIGWSDILALATNPQGWAAYGHPEWGAFKLGKTNPNLSTSGLSALIAQNYAATGKTRDLTAEDVSTGSVMSYNANVESAVVHYGDTTLTFLDNWYRADQQGTGMQYVSAVAVEEKSVIDYNEGNPDGQLDPGEAPRPPRVPLVAIYPKEGTLYSDNPFFVLDAPWVSDQQRAGAKAFEDFVQQPDNQTRVLQYNFRPGNPTVDIGAPIDADHGVDPDQPQTLLQVPPPPVLVKLLDNWGDERKGARVLLVMDVSGSMKQQASGNSPATKLDLAKAAATGSLSEFKPDDLVGLREFSTGLGPDQTLNWVDLVTLAPMERVQSTLTTQIEQLVPTNGTPLYDVVLDSFQMMYDTYDPTRINAVVLLTDGKNDDGTVADDSAQLDHTISELQRLSQGELGKPVRVFTIGYGTDADLSVLKQIAEATNAASYNAGDPRSIDKVFTAVVSNF